MLLYYLNERESEEQSKKIIRQMIKNKCCNWQFVKKSFGIFVKPGANESEKNKRQNGLAHSRFIVCVTPKQKKNIAWFENHVLAEHVRNSQSTIYLKSHGCVHGFQNEVLLINFSTMFC